jgi:hypothetical protein
MVCEQSIEPSGIEHLVVVFDRTADKVAVVVSLGNFCTPGSHLLWTVCAVRFGCQHAFRAAARTIVVAIIILEMHHSRMLLHASDEPLAALFQ